MDLRSPPLEPSDGDARREAPLGAAGLSGRRHRLDRPGLYRDLSGCRAQWTDGSKFNPWRTLQQIRSLQINHFPVLSSGLVWNRLAFDHAADTKETAP